MLNMSQGQLIESENTRDFFCLFVWFALVIIDSILSYKEDL